VVLLLSKAFISQPLAMAEVQELLERNRRQGPAARLVPVCCGVTPEDVFTHCDELYHAAADAAADEMHQWAATWKELQWDAQVRDPAILAHPLNVTTKQCSTCHVAGQARDWVAACSKPCC
jgi:hypothetical protein